ncbi:MAG: hypothetical protein WKF81_03870 [Thermomicrobiales bacterium]
MLALNRKSSLPTLLLALALVLVPLLGSARVVAAQDTGLIDDEIYVSELSEEEVTWSSDWAVDEDSITVESDVESFVLTAESGLLYVIYVAGVGGSLDLYLEDYTDGFLANLGDVENLDADSAGDGFYALDLIEDAEFEYTAFSVITEVEDAIRLDIAITTSDFIEDHVDEIKSSIEFDGAEAFENIDAVTDSSVEVASQPDDDEPVEDDEDVTPTPEDDELVEDDEDVTPIPEDEDGTDDGDGNDTDFSNATEYTFGLNDAVVAWQDPWEFEPTLNYVEPDYESIGFVDGTSFQSIIYLPTGVDLDAARDAFLEGFVSDDVAIQVIDRGSYDNEASEVSYSLDLVEIEDILFGLFTVYIDNGDNVLAYATLALADDVGESLDLAKETITINGDAVYNGVTGGGLQDLIDASSDSFTPTDTVAPDNDTDDDTEDPTPDTDEDPTPDDDVDPDAQDYLDTVREDYDALDASVARFDELVSSGELSDADFDELISILELWGAASLNADSLDVPAGYEDLHQVYLEYTGALQEASFSFITAISVEADSTEQEEAFAIYDSARINIDEYAAMLEDLLDDAGV